MIAPALAEDEDPADRDRRRARLPGRGAARRTLGRPRGPDRRAGRPRPTARCSTGWPTRSARYRRPKVPVPLLTPWLSSLWIGLVTPVDAGVARPLVEGLSTETVVTDPSGAALFDVEPTPFDDALREATRRGPVVTALALVLLAPATAVTGTDVELEVRRARPGAIVRFEQRRDGEWRRVGRDRAGRKGQAKLSLEAAAPRPVRGAGRGSEGASEPAGARPLALPHARRRRGHQPGQRPGRVHAPLRLPLPVAPVAPTLRAADIAFGNLECAVSRRGVPVPQAVQLPRPARRAARVARFAGFDVLNLANNHVGDYGRAAFLDTLRFTRALGMTPVGGGREPRGHSAAGRETHGLRVAFVGFSDRLPLSFYADVVDGRASRSPPTPAIGAPSRRARRRADVVVATFHWGDERSHSRTRASALFARAALQAGAHAVIGAHPHVLQPRHRLGRRDRRLQPGQLRVQHERRRNVADRDPAATAVRPRRRGHASAARAHSRRAAEAARR